MSKKENGCPPHETALKYCNNKLKKIYLDYFLDILRGPSYAYCRLACFLSVQLKLSNSYFWLRTQTDLPDPPFFVILSMSGFSLWPIFTFTSLTFSRLSQHCLRHMSIQWLFCEPIWSKAPGFGVSIFWDHVWAMFGPCLNHVWPRFIFTPAKALKFSRLSQHGPILMSRQC